MRLQRARKTPILRAMIRKLNFNAGPATLPLVALERAQAELTDFAQSGMSVMEHSHRGKEYEAVHEEATSLLRELLSVPADMEVLFLQGGASQQFATLPMNFLTPGASADYALTGVWGEKAVGEAKTVAAMVGAKVRIAASTGVGDGKEKSYTRAPTQAEIEPDSAAAYVHFTSNETIHGVQYAVAPGAHFPDFGGAPLLCDMSSDFMWRPIDLSRFDLVYAGAQKNIGPSGLVVVIAKKSMIERGRKDIPKIFQYRVHAENKSLYNTPPTFAIYLVRNVLAWVKAEGGLQAIERANREKAGLIYGAIDANAAFYRAPVEVASRSLMNVVFRLPSEALEERFVSEAKKHDMMGLKGPRSVGGARGSLYNAVPGGWAKALGEFMNGFGKQNG